MKTLKIKCPKCKGSGYDRPSENHSYSTCHPCEGAGIITIKQYQDLTDKTTKKKK